MNKIIPILTIILLSPISALSAIAKEISRSTQTVQNQHQSKYEYADGSGNLYIINSQSIDYRPITREQSSSGNYDGGKPRKVKIDARQYQSIAVKLDRALNLRSIQIEDSNMGRAKGTGLISKQDKDRQIQSRVISMNSPERREIEALLNWLISNSPQQTLRER